MPSYPAKLFVPPNGRQDSITVTKIRQDEVDFFTTHSVKLSMEELSTGQVALYGDWGNRAEDGEPIEVVYLVETGQSCEDAMARLRVEIEKEREAKESLCQDEGCPHYGTPHICRACPDQLDGWP